MISMHACVKSSSNSSPDETSTRDSSGKDEKFKFSSVIRHSLPLIEICFLQELFLSLLIIIKLCSALGLCGVARSAIHSTTHRIESSHVIYLLLIKNNHVDSVGNIIHVPFTDAVNVLPTSMEKGRKNFFHQRI